MAADLYKAGAHPLRGLRALAARLPRKYLKMLRQGLFTKRFVTKTLQKNL